MTSLAFNSEPMLSASQIDYAIFLVKQGPIWFVNGGLAAVRKALWCNDMMVDNMCWYDIKFQHNEGCRCDDAVTLESVIVMAMVMKMTVKVIVMVMIQTGSKGVAGRTLHRRTRTLGQQTLHRQTRIPGDTLHRPTGATGHRL